jgi:plastocyanin
LNTFKLGLCFSKWVLRGIWIISVLVSILVLGGFAYVHYAEADFRDFTQTNIEDVRDPNLLDIVIGDTITFSNHDVVPHELEIEVPDGTIVRSEVSSTSLSNDDHHDHSFTSQFEVNAAEVTDVTRYQLDSMQSFSYTFSSVGTYEVIDPNHQDVVGRIVVLDEENEDTSRDYVFSQTFNQMMAQMMVHSTSHEEDDNEDKDDNEPPVPTGTLQDPAEVCSAAARTISYTILAINVDITLNRFGDHDPSGRMYVLEENLDAVRAQETSPLPRVSTGLGDDPIQPLVIRANLGDCVKIIFKNQLNSERASIHFHKVAVLPAGDGSAVGNNPDSTIPPGETITYTVFLEPKSELEGAAYFHSHGDNAREQVAHGLFGALIAEPEGSVFLHPETGLPLKSGWEAMIAFDDSSIPAFREFATLYHEIGDEKFRILNKDGVEITREDESGVYRPCSKALNYRSECFMNRLDLVFDESMGYSSYFFGDPATPIPRSYLGDPAKTRLIHGGSEMFHVHHLHGGAGRTFRWR